MSTDKGSPRTHGEPSEFVGKEDKLLDARSDDDQYDLTLRPQMLSDYVGQVQVKDNLGILLEAARRRGEPVEHVLLCGPTAATLPLPHFTCVGATTRQGLLSGPLRDRFGAVYRLDFYTKTELESIVTRSARILAIEIHDDAVSEIARRARGTPRIANRLLRRVRDYAQVRGDGRATVSTTRLALEMLEVDEIGLEPLDRQLLETVIVKFKGGPVGLDTLATSLSEEPET